MSHEFELHHRVSSLISLLKVQDVSGSEAYVEVLLANRTPYVTSTVSTQAAKRKIAELSSKGEAFLKKYEELKLKQPRDLDPLVYLLSKMAVDRPLCEFIRVRRPDKPKPPVREASITEVFGKVDGEEVKLPPKGAILTAEELSQLMGKLETLTADIQGQQKKQQVKKPPGTYPEMPAWLTERPYLSYDFVSVAGVVGGGGGAGVKRGGPLLQPPPSSAATPPAVRVGSLPLEMQQLVVMEDILHLMVGVDGRYVTAQRLPYPQQGGGGSGGGGAGTSAGGGGSTSGSSPRQFDVDPSLDVSLRVLVGRILSVCGHYSSVVRFVERNADYVNGRVNQALAAAMRDLIREYLIVVAQLEHQLRADRLTAQKLWYYAQPCLRTLEVLSRVAFLVDRGECRGGKTLSVLHGMSSGFTGDQRAQELCLHLTQEASRPYFEMLEKWIHKGMVVDPYGEFMIEEHEVKRNRLREEYNDAYWEGRYTVVQENIPSFLERVAGKVQDTGKYLNVLCECAGTSWHRDGGDSNSGSVEEEEEKEGGGGGGGGVSGTRELRYSVQEVRYVECIEEAYTRASRRLLVMMMREKDLMGHLRSIKHYFLVDQGDFFVHFMDTAEGELRKTSSDISLMRLESLLELALHSSLVVLDPYGDNLRPVLIHCDLITQLRDIIGIEAEAIGTQALTPRSIRRTTKRLEELTGLEAFGLDYVVQWPLSLVLNRKALFKYQMLFRHLFHCLYTERQLCVAWTGHRIGKACPLSLFPVYAASFALLQRMLHFVQNLQYFMAFEVLEPHWSRLEGHLHCPTSTITMDDVLAAHTDFLDRCLKDCMLSNKEAIERIHHLLCLCTQFAQQMQQVITLVDGGGGGGSKGSGGGGVGGGPSLPAAAGGGKKAGKSRQLSANAVPKALQAAVTSKGFEHMVTRTERDFTESMTKLLRHLHQLGTQDVEHMTSGMASRLDFNGFYQVREQV